MQKLEKTWGPNYAEWWSETYEFYDWMYKKRPVIEN